MVLLASKRMGMLMCLTSGMIVGQLLLRMTNLNKPIESLSQPKQRNHSLSRSEGSDNNSLTDDLNNSISNNSNARVSCTYEAMSDNEVCLSMLSEKLHGSQPHRWLFFGDSTMAQTFRFSQLLNHLVVNASSMVKTDPCLSERFECEVRESQPRCNRGLYYNISNLLPNETRTPNDTVGEGPVAFGRRQPGCSDCIGCVSIQLFCTPKPPPFNLSMISDDDLKMRCLNTMPPLHGGYLMMEFSRDVEMQSAQFRTSQENIRAWLSSVYNAPSRVEAFGKPVCVLLAGFHDMLVGRYATSSRFANNVHWLLDLFQSECHHIVWLANTAPGNMGRYVQTRAKTYEWNEAVRNMLLEAQSSPLSPLRDRVSFLDVFNSSTSNATRQPEDNIHLSPKWYGYLGDMFIEAMNITRQQEDVPIIIPFSSEESSNASSSGRHTRWWSFLTQLRVARLRQNGSSTSE